MLFTSWRNEEVDLISSCASYQSRYQQLCHSIKEKMKEYAIYDQDFAKLEQQMATVEEHYDRIAPCTQDIEHQDEMEGNTDLTPELNESYNLSDDLGIPMRHRSGQNCQVHKYVCSSLKSM